MAELLYWDKPVVFVSISPSHDVVLCDSDIVPRTVIIPTRPKRSHNSWSYLSFYGSSHCVSEQWKPQLPAIFEGKLNNLLTR